MTASPAFAGAPGSNPTVGEQRTRSHAVPLDGVIGDGGSGLGGYPGGDSFFPEPPVLMGRGQAFIFDLDGTLIDSVYQQVLAWQEALERMGMGVSVWRIHRKIGMSGGLFAAALARETGHQLSGDEAAQLRRLHATAYAARSSSVRPLSGAREVLRYLTGVGVPWAIATSGYLENVAPTLRGLEVPDVFRWLPATRWLTPSRTRI